jgi:hypothetical protein
MKRIAFVVILFASATGLAEPVGFLEKRVPEELATEGVVLSRRNLGLQVEQVGDKLLISLVDLSTGRVAASTKLDPVPADREAQIAQVTHLAADLATQLSGRAEPAPPPPQQQQPQTVLVDDRAERKKRELADFQYKRESIHFGQEFEVHGSIVNGNGSIGMTRRWIAYRGELDQELEPEEFYNVLGREDLAEEYEHRRRIMIGGYVVAGVSAVVGLGAMTVSIFSHRDDCSVSLPPDQFSMCLANADSARAPYLTVAIASLIPLTIGGAVAFWYRLHPHPISEGEAKSLADEYNQVLRYKLGLPHAAQRTPLLRDVKLAPYAAGTGGGLALSATF